MTKKCDIKSVYSRYRKEYKCKIKEFLCKIKPTLNFQLNYLTKS